MRILFVDQFSSLGGAQLCLRDLLPFIVGRGWQAHLAVPGGGSLCDEFRRWGCPVHRLRDRTYANGKKKPGDLLRFPFDSLRDASEIREIVRMSGTDLVYVNGPRMVAAASWSGVPVLFHAHLALNKHYAKLLVGTAVRRCGATAVACSRFVAGELQASAGGIPVRTVYNGVPDLSRPRRGDRRPCIGMIGRIAPEKGQVDFLKAAALVRNGGSHPMFRMYGAPLFGNATYSERVLALARIPGVEVCGWVDDVASALSELDVLVVPSTAPEGCPRVVLEALSAGVPVVAYSSGGLAELVTKAVGITVEVGNVGGLAAAVSMLLERPALREFLASNARAAWEQQFRVERFGQEMCEAIVDCSRHGVGRLATKFSTAPVAT